jgi:superfamily II DNA or RNA helicase
MKGKNKQKNNAAKGNRDKEPQRLDTVDVSRLEFHRHGVALIPHPADRGPGVAMMVEDDRLRQVTRLCSCPVSKSGTCRHVLELSKIWKSLDHGKGVHALWEAFKKSLWHRLAEILADGFQCTRESVRVAFSSASPSAPEGENPEASGKSRIMRVVGSNGETRLYYLSSGADALRFLERCGRTPEGSPSHRAAAFQSLALMTLTDSERRMMEMGFQTRGQALEKSFWHLLAYHAFRELGPEGFNLRPEVEEATGAFTIICCDRSGNRRFRIFIPRDRVRSLLTGLRPYLPNQHDLEIHPLPLKSIFKVSLDTQMDLELRPMIQFIQESGEAQFFEREDLERFRYGDLIYVKELGIIAELEKPGPLQRQFTAPKKMILKKSQVPSFLQEFGEEILNGPHIAEGGVESIRVFKEWDQVEIDPEAIERDWCWLSVKYGFGNSRLSLQDILRAKRNGERYVGVEQGWVDCESSSLEGLKWLSSMKSDDTEKDAVRLSRLDLFRLMAVSPTPVNIGGNHGRKALLESILAFKPFSPFSLPKGMITPLRPYQREGLDWLGFLYENGLGGLLCDDMGLGKTHEAMAFVACLMEKKKAKGPFLVVSPTTVLSHWERKLSQHAPGIKAAVYHGGSRDMDEALKKARILLTTYGVLRRDIDKLRTVSFAVAIFDEIQYLKNPETQAYQCAGEIRAHMKVGLTGTPIENRIQELKALLDLTVPGYLGNDGRFRSRYLEPIEKNLEGARTDELRRLISPVTLRRRKETVLQDLPPKIEDIRTCMLSEDQVKLYREALDRKAPTLVSALKKKREKVPYIHIFALLTLLKQICDHPALLSGKEPGVCENSTSGKWDLFEELLAECLDSGQKVVVYSQFLGMIELMEKHLQARGVGFVSLTGKSRNRGEIVARFNEDPDCKVYVGSLKAGGTGIDLVAASVVVHYDRWWNAAKEDQATDRVHRIGQRRGVQVFKLVTEGTLEEKIGAIIEKKRRLMESVVKENDPAFLKTFTREELIQLLTFEDRPSSR